MDINEAGRDVEALGIQAGHTLPFLDRANVEDFAIFNCHAPTKGWRSCAINNRPVVNQEIRLHPFVPYLAVQPRSIAQSTPVIAPAISEQR